MGPRTLVNQHRVENNTWPQVRLGARESVPSLLERECMDDEKPCNGVDEIDSTGSRANSSIVSQYGRDKGRIHPLRLNTTTATT